MSDAERPEINMSRIKVSGIGGLGMVAIAAAMAYALPEARWFVLGSLAGGFVAAAALVAYRRWIKPEPPHEPTLMVDTPAVADQTPERPGIDRTIKSSARPRVDLSGLSA